MDHYEKVWREFEQNDVSHSIAHYLLAVTSLSNEKVDVKAADVARKLGVSRNAVSLQMNTLKSSNFISVDERQCISLTKIGESISARIASKRHTMNVFFSEVLGVSEETAETDACKIEHLISDSTGEALSKFVSFLRSDQKVVLDFLKRFQEHYVGCDPKIGCGLCDNIEQISSAQTQNLE